MDIDAGAIVAYYKQADVVREARQARLAGLFGARQAINTARANVLSLLCRLEIPVLQPACALTT
jgi:hypothetical protein